MGCGHSSTASSAPTPAAAPTTDSTAAAAAAPSTEPATTAGSSAPAPSAALAQHLNEAAVLEQELRQNASMASNGSAASGESTAAPAWQSFTPEQLSAIEEARAAVKAQGPLVIDPKGTYGLICRACSKPNSTNVTFCTGCSFPSTVEDIQRLPDNIFLLLVQGQDIGATVRFRDADTIVFDDKYAVSDNHLDIIPTAVYADCTVLTAEHIPMLERLYALGKAELLSRNIGWLPADADIDSLITAGYNFPVSVKHLHLHMVLPPFKHEKVFAYPRWHAHSKIIADLKAHGKVQLYCDHPGPESDAAGEAEYKRAMANSEKATQLKAAWEEAQKQ